jgi:hypothetical protein
MKRLAAAIIVLSLAGAACVFPVRTGSDAQATDIAYGATKGAPTAVAEYIKTQEAGKNAPTEAPGRQSLAEEAREGFRTSSSWQVSFEEPDGPVLFTVKTVKQKGEAWSGVNLFDTPGVPRELGFGSSSYKRVVQLTHGVELFVHDTVSMDHYLQVVLEAWMETGDIDNLQGSITEVVCYWHDWDHIGEPMCHGHLYSTPDKGFDTLIGFVEERTAVKILEIDTVNRMVKVALPLLWVEAALTERE